MHYYLDFIGNYHGYSFVLQNRMILDETVSKSF